MKLKVLAVERDGDARTSVTLSVDAPYNDVIARLAHPGEDWVLTRVGDEVRGGCLRDEPPPPPSSNGRVINRAADILGSADRDG